MEFSIITPIYIGNDHEKERRLELFKKTIESVKNQTFRDFEWIIVNDGSTVPLKIPKLPFIKIIDQKNLQRITAFETGMRESKGKILCFLDSDDEYYPDTLQIIHDTFKKYPKYKLFHFGAKFQHKDGVITERLPNRFDKAKQGFKIFGGGKIVNGTFVFSREVYEKVGGYPPHEVKDIDCSEIGYGEGKRNLYMTSPYDFSAYAQMEFPEIRPFFQEKHPDHPRGLVRELGNPFGQDYYLFYKFTRKYQSKPIDKFILKVNLK